MTPCTGVMNSQGWLPEGELVPVVTPVDTARAEFPVVFDAVVSSAAAVSFIVALTGMGKTAALARYVVAHPKLKGVSAHRSHQNAAEFLQHTGQPYIDIARKDPAERFPAGAEYLLYRGKSEATCVQKTRKGSTNCSKCPFKKDCAYPTQDKALKAGRVRWVALYQGLLAGEMSFLKKRITWAQIIFIDETPSLNELQPKLSFNELEDIVGLMTELSQPQLQRITGGTGTLAENLWAWLLDGKFAPRDELPLSLVRGVMTKYADDSHAEALRQFNHLMHAKIKGVPLTARKDVISATTFVAAELFNLGVPVVYMDATPAASYLLARYGWMPAPATWVIGADINPNVDVTHYHGRKLGATNRATQKSLAYYMLFLGTLKGSVLCVLDTNAIAEQYRQAFAGQTTRDGGAVTFACVHALAGLDCFKDLNQFVYIGNADLSSRAFAQRFKNVTRSPMPKGATFSKGPQGIRQYAAHAWEFIVAGPGVAFIQAIGRMRSLNRSQPVPCHFFTSQPVQALFDASGYRAQVRHVPFENALAHSRVLLDASVASTLGKNGQSRGGRITAFQAERWRFMLQRFGGFYTSAAWLHAVAPEQFATVKEAEHALKDVNVQALVDAKCLVKVLRSVGGPNRASMCHGYFYNKVFADAAASGGPTPAYVVQEKQCEKMLALASAERDGTLSAGALVLLAVKAACMRDNRGAALAALRLLLRRGVLRVSNDGHVRCVPNSKTPQAKPAR